MGIRTEIKNCTKCCETKLINEFRKQKKGKYGVMSVCKICQSKIEKENRLMGNSTSKIRNKRHYELHTEICKKAQKRYRERIKIDKQIYDKKYRSENKDSISLNNIFYYKKFPHLQTWRSVLKSSLKRLGKPKEGYTIDLLGYSATDLKNHLESLFTDGMSWDNRGEWHVDHIKRVSEFDKDTHPSIVNALSNLRPLWATTREINGVIYEGNLNRG